MTAAARRVLTALTAVALGAPTAAVARSPNDPDIAAAIRRGRAAVARGLGSGGASGEKSLAALALVKTGSSPDDPAVAGVLAAIDAATADGRYSPHHHTYTAGITLMLLQAAGRPEDDPALRAVYAYVLNGQRSYGGWFYPSGGGQGDTSITQYAALGLWSAEEAGLDVPVAAWDRLARWQSRTAVAGGGFTYHPPGGRPSSTMTLAGIGTLSLCGRYLGVAAGRDRETKKSGRKRFGFLEAVAEDAPRDGDAPERREVKRTTSATAIRGATANAIAVMLRRPRFPGNAWQFYELYALERAVALSGPGRWGRVDWYAQGVAYLLPKQAETGLWKSPAGGESAPLVASSFAMLFLSKSTHKSLGVTDSPPAAALGDGLLAGGRGLPGDLAAVSVRGGRVETRELTAPLDRLLADLEAAPAERVTAAGTDALQRDLVAAVRGGARDELVGRLDALAGLARNRDPAVRRVAAWALGRSGGEAAAVVLVRLLRGDANFSVQREAHAALLFLSRRAAGGDVREPAGHDDRVRWRDDAVAEWTEWLKSAGPAGSERGLRPVDDPLFEPGSETAAID